MKPCILLLTAFLFKTAISQSTFLYLKKNNKTIQRFYNGSTIDFFTKDNQPVSGQIDSIKNDILYLTQFQTRLVQHAFGFTITDTIARYYVQFYLSDIGYLPVKKKHFSYFKDGSFFKLAGGGYLALNILNGGAGNGIFSSVNRKNLIIGVGLVATGLVLANLKRKFYPIGNTFKLVYVN